MPKDEKKSGIHIGRRAFLKGFAASAVGVATGSVLESSPSNAKTTSTETKNPTWLGDAPVISDNEIVDTVKADIVIVGGGNAGSMCAMAAAEKGGVTIAVIESQAKDKIVYHGLHDIASLNSQYCLSRGIPEIKHSEFISDYLRRFNCKCNPRLVKKFAENSGELVDWLIEKSPQEVVDAVRIIAKDEGERYFELGAEVNKFKCWRGSINMNYNAAAPTLIAKAEDQGATWYWGHKGIVLITETSEITGKKDSTDENGVLTRVDTTIPQTAVKGVIATNPEGEYIKFVAKKAVVLAGGGYGGNPAMYSALQDEQRQLYESHGLDASALHSSVGRDGSAIKMGLWAGGSMDPGTRLRLSRPGGDQSDTYASNVLGWSDGTTQRGAVPAIWVDSSGRRFTDEAFLGSLGLVIRAQRMKPQRLYGFFDNGHWKEQLSRTPIEHYSRAGMPNYEALQATFDSCVERGALGGEPQQAGPPGMEAPTGQTVCLWGANTLDELFEYMGFDDEIKAAVSAEIDRYNAFCENGEDEDFGKDPKMLLPINEGPFYGVFCVLDKPLIGIVTLNGLVIDENQSVLDKNYNPIVNLYACGNSSGGRFGFEYSTPLQGLTLGMAMTLGRVLGKELAE